MQKEPTEDGDALMLKIDFTRWTKATGDLLPGQQRVFKDFLETVASGDTTLVFGADVRAGSPCLVNGVQVMMSETQVSPTAAFPHLVSAFDSVCWYMQTAGLAEKSGYVSPLMAEFLLRNFGEIKPMDVEQPPAIMVEGVIHEGIYIEPSDEQMLEFCDMLTEYSEVNEPENETEQVRSE